MSLEAFHHSEPLTLGVELELQLVNTNDYDLAPYAEDMLRLMKKTPLPGSVVPEMTSSMIEISTGMCQSAAARCVGQLTPIRDALVKSADKLNIAVVGRRHAPLPAVARAPHLRQAALSRALGAVRLPVQAVHHLWPARAHWLPQMPTRPCSCCTA